MIDYDDWLIFIEWSVSAYAIWRFWWCQKIKAIQRWLKSRSRNKEKQFTIDLYMLKESLKMVAKVWPLKDLSFQISYRNKMGI